MVALCGGNIDTTVLGRCLERSLAADDRLCRFVVTVSDRPGNSDVSTRLDTKQRAVQKDKEKSLVANKNVFGLNDNWRIDCIGIPAHY